MKRLALTACLFSTPVAAASGPFFSLHNTDFVVAIAFLLFVALLVWLKVPGKVAGLLDRRAERIASELDEARRLRDEAKALLESFEAKRREVDGQAERIVERATEDAQTAAEQAREDLKAAIERRMKAAEDRIASAEASAVREVRDAAATVAVQAAGDVIAKRITSAEADALVDSAINEAVRRIGASN